MALPRLEELKAVLRQLDQHAEESGDLGRIRRTQTTFHILLKGRIYDIEPDLEPNRKSLTTEKSINENEISAVRVKTPDYREEVAEPMEVVQGGGGGDNGHLEQRCRAIIEELEKDQLSQGTLSYAVEDSIVAYVPWHSLTTDGLVNLSRMILKERDTLGDSNVAELVSKAVVPVMLACQWPIDTLRMTLHSNLSELLASPDDVDTDRRSLVAEAMLATFATKKASLEALATHDRLVEYALSVSAGLTQGAKAFSAHFLGLLALTESISPAALALLRTVTDLADQLLADRTVVTALSNFVAASAHAKDVRKLQPIFLRLLRQLPTKLDSSVKDAMVVGLQGHGGILAVKLMDEVKARQTL
jgi:hypothetical protein